MPSVTFTFQIAVTSSSVSTVIGNLTESAMNQWATQNGLPDVVLASIGATCGMGREPSVPDQDCMSCKPGYFKFLLDNTTCQACAANTYLNSTGGTNCLPCPSNTSAASGSAVAVGEQLRGRSRGSAPHNVGARNPAEPGVGRGVGQQQPTQRQR